MIYLARVALVVAGIGVLGPACARQGTSTQSAELTEGQAILQELREIRKLLEANPPGGRVAAAARPARPARAKVSLADGHLLGSENAPLTLLEFTDYQCPFCNRFSSNTLPELQSTYIDTGKLRLVSRDLPLAIHANAKQAANAARCAQEQDHYWEMRGAMFANQTRLDQTSLIGLANDLGLDAGEFSTCLTSDRHGDKVQRGATEAAALGITGTPTFVLGRTSGDVLEGEVIVGAQPFATFDVRIKALLGDTN